MEPFYYLLFGALTAVVGVLELSKTNKDRINTSSSFTPFVMVLMLGRVLGGIATSLLFSAFESWPVAEHNKRGLERHRLSRMFSKAVFLGNDLCAILAGLFGNLLVDTLALGPVSPFDAAAILLAIGMEIIMSSWPKN